MKKHINAISVLITLATIILSCLYLYSQNKLYDSALISNTVAFYFTMPLVALMNLYHLIMGNDIEQKPSKLWHKIVAGVIVLAAFALILYMLIDSHFYDLSSLIITILAIVALPNIFAERVLKEKYAIPQLLLWSAMFTQMYLIIAGTTFAYIKIVEPTTVSQATEIVEQKFGEDNFDFKGHLNIHGEHNHMGVYWFIADGSTWVEIDVIDGTMNILE